MKEKKRAGLFVLVLIAAILVLGAIPAYAAMLSKDITVFTGVSIYVDGRELHPADVNGNEVEAFIYEGTTYVPLRAVGESLGADVSWDKESKTVYLNSNRAGEPEERVAKFDAGSGDIIYTCGPMKLSSKWCDAELDGFTLIDSKVGFNDRNHVNRERLYEVFAIFTGTVISSERDYFMCYASYYDKDGELLRCDKIYEHVRENGPFTLKCVLTVPSDTARLILTPYHPELGPDSE